MTWPTCTVEESEGTWPACSVDAPASVWSPCGGGEVPINNDPPFFTGILVRDADGQWAFADIGAPDGYVVQDVDGEPAYDDAAVAADYDVHLTSYGRPELY